jgi:hypothetical protein
MMDKKQYKPELIIAVFDSASEDILRLDLS